jgi:hypothetical protein
MPNGISVSEFVECESARGCTGRPRDAAISAFFVSFYLSADLSLLYHLMRLDIPSSLWSAVRELLICLKTSSSCWGSWCGALFTLYLVYV